MLELSSAPRYLARTFISSYTNCRTAYISLQGQLRLRPISTQLLRLNSWYRGSKWNCVLQTIGI